MKQQHAQQTVNNIDVKNVFYVPVIFIKNAFF